MLNKGAAGSLCTGRAWGPAMPSLSSLDVWTALHSSMIQHSFPACSSEAPAPTSGGPYQRAHVSRWQPQLGGKITCSVTCQHQSDEFQYWGWLVQYWGWLVRPHSSEEFTKGPTDFHLLSFYTWSSGGTPGPQVGKEQSTATVSCSNIRTQAA